MREDSSIHAESALLAIVFAPQEYKQPLMPQVPTVVLAVYKNDGERLAFWFEKHSTKKKFDDPSVSMKDSPYYYREYTEPTTILVDGQEGFRFYSTTMFGRVEHVILSSPDSLYIIDIEASPKMVIDFYTLFNQILSTFKFLD